jgi:ribonuclease D
VMLELARNPVKSVEKLGRIRGLPRPVEQAYGQAIVAATLKALALPASELPVPKHLEENPTERFRADGLWSAVQAICAGQSIDAALVSSRQEMGEVSKLLSAGRDPGEAQLMKGWRRKAVGETLVRMVEGKAEVRLGWKDGALHTTL